MQKQPPPHKIRVFMDFLWNLCLNIHVIKPNSWPLLRRPALLESPRRRSRSLRNWPACNRLIHRIELAQISARARVLHYSPTVSGV